MAFVGKLGDQSFTVEIEETGKSVYRVSVDGNEFVVDGKKTGRTNYSLIVDNRSFEIEVDSADDEYRVLVDGRSASSAELAAVGLDDFEHGADIVLDVKAAEDRGLLRQIAYADAGPLVHWQSGHVVAVQLDPAVIGGDQAGNHIEHRGFSGAVRPKQADRFAPPDIKRDAFDDLAIAEALLDRVRGARIREQTREGEHERARYFLHTGLLKAVLDADPIFEPIMEAEEEPKE